MTVAEALSARFTELEASPPEDIFNAILFEMVAHGVVVIIWDVSPRKKRVDMAELTASWQALLEKRPARE